MLAEEKIALDCPYCGEAIYQPLSWFKKPYSTCPACDRGLAAGQFAAAVAEIEEALDECIDERVMGKPGCGSCGCGDKSSCAKE